MLKKVNRKTKKTAPLVHVKPGCNRARPQSLSDEAKKNAVVSKHLPARDRKIILAMARILAGKL